MNIVYLFNGRLPTEKAHGLQIVKSCEALSELGYQVTLIIPRLHNPLRRELFNYYPTHHRFALRVFPALDPSGWSLIPEWVAYGCRTITGSIAMGWAILKYGTDDVLFYARDWTSLMLLAFFRQRFVAEIHDYRASRSRWFVEYILKHAARVIVNSTGTLGMLNTHYPHLQYPSLVVPNGVDVEAFTVRDDISAVRRQLSLPLDKKLIGYVGRLETAGVSKGIDVFLDAMGILIEKGPDVVALVVGGPADEVARLRRVYHHRQIVWVGHVGPHQIPLYLRALDRAVISLPNNHHAQTTSPLKVFEFLAAGAVIIAADLPALRTCLNDANAYFFNPGDSTDLARVIEMSLEDSTANQRSIQAHHDALSYDWRTRAQRIIDFIS